MKKFFCFLVVLSFLFFVGCKSKENEEEPKDFRKNIYLLAQESGYEGTYEEWLASISGEQIMLIVDMDGNLRWKYQSEDDTKYRILFNMNSLKGSTGNGVEKIELTNSNELIDTYTVYYTDGTSTTFEVTNGNTGEKGDTGNGIEKIELTSTNGLVDTYTVFFTDGTSTTFEVINGENGVQGNNGNGILKVEKTSSSGLVDTYTVYFTDGTSTTFEVTNGENGVQGNNGNGILKVEKTSSSGLVDTYTVYFTDGTSTTFEITNGENGLSAYEIYLKYHPEYNKSEKEWMDDLVNGRLADKEYVTVKFETGCDEVISDVVIEKGEKLSQPKELERDGFDFVGWFFGEKEWDFDLCVVDANLTLVAKWEVSVPKVVFDCNNGFTEELLISTGNKIVTIPISNSNNKNGGYWVDANYEKYIFFNDRSNEPSATFSDRIYIGKDANSNFYTVKEIIMSGTGSKWPNGAEYVITIGATYPSYKDYHLSVENINIGHIVIIDGDIENASNGNPCNISIYEAQTKEHVYSVFKDDYNGLPVATRYGYEFIGWVDKNNQIVNELDASSINRTIYLTASWKRTNVLFKITYDLDGGIADNLVTEFDEDQFPELVTPVKEGYKFLGWFEGDELISEITENTNYSLVARWEIIVPAALEIVANDTKIEQRLNMYLTVKFTPENAFKDVNWYSSDETILVVNSNGRITAKCIGKAVITVFSRLDSNVSASIEIEVLPESQFDRSKLYVSPDWANVTGTVNYDGIELEIGKNALSSVADAILQADNGTCIYILPGTYNEELEIDKGISFIGVGENVKLTGVIIFTNSIDGFGFSNITFTENATLSSLNDETLSFKNFTINDCIIDKPASVDDATIHFYGYSENHSFSNCLFLFNTYRGLRWEQEIKNLSIINCKFDSTGIVYDYVRGMYIVGGEVLVKDCEFLANNQTTIQFRHSTNDSTYSFIDNTFKDAASSYIDIRHYKGNLSNSNVLMNIIGNTFEGGLQSNWGMVRIWSGEFNSSEKIAPNGITVNFHYNKIINCDPKLTGSDAPYVIQHGDGDSLYGHVHGWMNVENNYFILDNVVYTTCEETWFQGNESTLPNDWYGSEEELDQAYALYKLNNQ